MSEFTRSLAVVIGVNDYGNGIAPLQTAVNDARELARLLKEEHGYEVWQLLDQEVTFDKLKQLLDGALPQAMGDNDRLLFYFAGHGIALNGEDGPAGYLVPQDARLGDSNTFFPMQRLHDAVAELSCRHLLVILDCCFAGAFRWSSTRDVGLVPETIYKERYDRFIQDAARQVITSASYDQRALDVLKLVDHRGSSGQYSPFASALFAALRGAADTMPPAKNDKPSGDGIITATELYLYLRDSVELATEGLKRQTPGLWPLKKHDKGEFIFLAPGHALNLPPAPNLNKDNNPYRGLESFDENHSKLFFGRERLVSELQTAVAEQPLTIVVGASGTGKSSLVKAGLLPALRASVADSWRILNPLRPSESPLTALARVCLELNEEGDADNLAQIEAFTKRLEKEANALADVVQQWSTVNAGAKLLLMIDQLEELMTLCRNEQERQQFLAVLEAALADNSEALRIVMTLRSDFEPQFLGSVLKMRWMSARYVIKPMTQDELRQAVEGPASERVLYFEPSTLIDQLINEVVQTPGALPLLSFTLSELYLKYLDRRGDNRALTQQDYEALGGVAGSLTQRATQEYDQLVKLDTAYQQTMQRVMLRMVAVEGGEVARRRVPLSELVYPDATENQRVDAFIQRLVEARLVVRGQDLTEESYVEPVHDALVRGWDKIQTWKNQEQENLTLQRLLTPAAREWLSNKKAGGFLWDDNPRILLLKQVLESGNNWLNQFETDFVERSLQRRRRNRFIGWGSVAAFVGMVSVAGLIANAQRIEALSARNAESQQRKEAEKQTGIAQQNAEEAKRQQKEAEKQTGIAQQNAEETKRQQKEAEKQTGIAQTNEERANEQAGLAQKNQREAEKQTKFARRNAQEAEERRQESENRRADAEIRALSASSEALYASNQEFEALLESLKAGVRIKFKTKINFETKIRVLATLQEVFYGVKELNRLESHTSWILSASFSHDGQTVVSGSKDGTIRTWNRNGTLLKVLAPQGVSSAVESVRFGPNDLTIASGSKDGTVRFWDLTGKEINSFRSKSGAILNLKYAPDGKSILLASGNNIEVWNIDGSLQRILKGHRYPVLDVKPSPDGQTLASISMDGIVRLWRQNGSFLRELPQEGFSHSITSGISFSPKGKIMATASGNNINLWNYESNTLIRTFKAHTDSVNSVNFSPDGQTVVSASSDRTVRIWDLEGQEIETLTGHTDPVLIAEFSSDGSTLLSAGIDKVIRLWMVGKKGDVTLNGYGDKAPDSVSQSLIDGRESKTINAGGGSVNSISINKENNLIAVASGGIVQIWNRGGKLLNTFQKYGEDTPLIWSIDFSPKNQILALATAEKNIQLWDSDGFKLKVLKGHTAEVKTVKFSPTGSFIASGSVSGEIKIWAYNGVLQKTLVGHEAEITSTSFSPDEQNLASASLDKTIRIWNVKSGIAKVIEHSNSDFEDIQFSPNGQFIAASNQDGVIGIWLKSGKKLRAWKAHSRTTTSISFSPDNQIIASASTDGTVKLWTLNGVLLKTLKVEDSKIWEIKFSSDGKFLASANSNNTVTLWNLNLDNLLVLGCDWIKDYLRSSARLSKEDRTLCDEVSHLSLMDVKPQ